ncbi:MAG: sulfite exporter TauE/SafE family protein [Devosia sp.]|uniref:sulfite exporter TauE/SafE family protein n=1 Tax=Devosia sp. TaxID=1871048 RepID=UPI001AD112E5|nr:sulfite exporter TauE/SafE family protein [Devosia sp.]MBN9309589.1 sulfite exporter TauE/SafE family protein [Devosia sp.]MBN9317938.1 sulfite exporter TauE/SafE family protein [Devosia sp.]
MYASIAAILSGGLVGFVLGLVGGGGSILATPLLLYVVGIANPHVAIGTGALAVSVSAALNLANYWRQHWIRWRPAIIFSAIGAAGTLAGSTLGKAIDGTQLLVLFGGVMFVVGLLMLRPRALDAASAPAAGWVLPVLALLTGAASGFFGIGGGFLIVPALLVATRMPIIEAVGTSLVAVTVFGLLTSLNYALSGYVEWMVAAKFIVGGIGGGIAGALVAGRLAQHKRALNTVLALIILSAAVYVTVQGVGTLVQGAA